MLIDCLNNLDRTFCYKRAFGIEKFIKDPDENKHSGMFFLYRMANWKRRLRYWFQRQGLVSEFIGTQIFAPDGNKDIKGFRLIYNKAVQYPEILNDLKESDTKVIHLIRENVLKTHISFLTAPIHKMYHPREGAKIQTIRVHLDPQTLLAELRQRIAKIDKMRKLIDAFPMLEISYESLVEDKNAQAARIQTFLGLNNVMPFETDLVKINPDSLDKVIENPAEIRELLTGTEFERLLY